MRKTNIILVLILFVSNLFATETWDILDKSMTTWNVDGGLATNKAWTYTKGKYITDAPAQKSTYVNVTKTYAYKDYSYGFLTPQALSLQANTAYTFEVKARVKPIDKELFPDIAIPGAGEGGFESNQISARLNNKNMAIHIKYGDAGEGYVSVAPNLGHNEDEVYRINTSEWHVYRFVFHADNLKYDVYIDDAEEAVFENVPTSGMTGSNILRLGAESTHRCNMDIEYVKMGTGDFNSKAKISSVSLASDSHVAHNQRTVSAMVHTILIPQGEKLLLSLTDASGADVAGPVEIEVAGDIATGELSIPASLPVGKYQLKAAAPEGKNGEVSMGAKTTPYYIVGESPIETKMLPQVKPVGFLIEMDDYIYQPRSKEFIFPSIVDTKTYTADGKFQTNEDTLARYYLFYTPHENPGEMYLATAPTLDGPWTERNKVIDIEWARAIPGNVINTASHISACQVVWNVELNKFVMYFHGPNTTTHYATSDNLRDWTFGASILNSKQFSSGSVEASYAKMFEHEIPGLGNKYVMMLMNQEGQIRRIYWAHSTDGVNWTPVRKPLVSPDLNYKTIPGTNIKPNYSGSFGNNVSGPFLMEKDGRYFVFCNGSSGNMFVVEVGESFDMEVHWGEYMKASDVVIDTDVTGQKVAVPRVAAPVFIQNDQGKWYMFFEAGGRLGANIAYAKEEGGNSTLAFIPDDNSVSIYPTLLRKGERFTLQNQAKESLRVEVMDSFGRKLDGFYTNDEMQQVSLSSVPGMYVVQVWASGRLLKAIKLIVMD